MTAQKGNSGIGVGIFWSFLPNHFYIRCNKPYEYIKTLTEWKNQTKQTQNFRSVAVAQLKWENTKQYNSWIIPRKGGNIYILVYSLYLKFQYVLTYNKYKMYNV